MIAVREPIQVDQFGSMRRASPLSERAVAELSARFAADLLAREWTHPRDVERGAAPEQVPAEGWVP